MKLGCQVIVLELLSGHSLNPVVHGKPHPDNKLYKNLSVDAITAISTPRSGLRYGGGSEAGSLRQRLPEVHLLAPVQILREKKAGTRARMQAFAKYETL